MRAAGRIEWLCVHADTPLTEVLRRLAGAAEKGLPAGIALVVDDAGELIGTVTDGDIRRALLKDGDLGAPAAATMNANPIAFADGLSYREILRRLPAELERRGRRTRTFLGKIVLVDAQRRPSRVLEYHQLWEQRVATHRHVVVIGLGYVGLTLALELAEEGFQVTGVDRERGVVDALARGESHVHEVGLPELLREQLARNFRVDHAVPDGGDVYVIAVGTPVSPGDPPAVDLAALEDAARMVGERLAPGDLVVLRSTVPVGTCRGFVLPMLERLSGLRGGTDFHLAFAPERTMEGKALQELRTLPQVIGGLNEDSVEATAALFRELTPSMVRVESLEAAEMVKLINNGFRDLVFSFANEVARIAGRFNLDAVEVIRAANRGYPRDPVPVPSPGVGGPCLTKDPYILAAAAAAAGIRHPLSSAARRVNESMHPFAADAVVEALRRAGKDPGQCTVLVCGLAFKGRPETADLRSSSSVEIARLLAGSVRRVLGHDPVAPVKDVRAAGIEPIDLPAGLRAADAVLFLNNHPSYEKLDVFEAVRSMRPPPIVYDPWRLLRAEDVLSVAGATYMGLGFSRTSTREDG